MVTPMPAGETLKTPLTAHVGLQLGKEKTTITTQHHQAL